MELAGDLSPVVVGNDGLGVLEPNGRFRMIDIASGRVRVDAKLAIDPKALPQSFVVVETLGQYLLMVNLPSNTRVRGTSTRAITVNGPCWAFARNNGVAGKPVSRPNWGPVQIENQAVEVDQPRHLPVLTFASRVYRPVQKALQPRPRTEYGVLVLDLRNGEIVHKENSALPVSAMRAVSSRVNQRVTLEFYRSTITLDFSDP
jgi:hypothetical protein